MNRFKLSVIAGLGLLAVQTTTAQDKGGFTTLPDGLMVKMNKDVRGAAANDGDIVKFHIDFKVKDSLIFSSKTMGQKNPIEQPVSPSKGVMDLMNGFKKLSKGDQATFKIKADKLFKGNNQKPPFIKADDMVVWEIDVLDVKTAQQIAQEKADAGKMENVAMEQYIKDNKIKGAKKMPSGLYIVKTKNGSGAKAMPGQKVTMNYTGYLLDGTVFDSNVLPKFGHVSPFEFNLGQGRVIKGWDEGVATLKVGDKAKFIIPSAMAYGPRAMPGNDKNPKGIPANSPLVFDVELVKVYQAEVEMVEPSMKMDLPKKVIRK